MSKGIRYIEKKGTKELKSLANLVQNENLRYSDFKRICYRLIIDFLF